MLADQHGRAAAAADAVDDDTPVVVAMVVTARRLRNLKAWERALRDRYDALDLVRVADIPQEPPVTVKQVADKLSKRVPEEISILIDIEGRWASELELDTSRPNLLILDGQGRLVDRFRGRHGPELFEQVCAAIDALGAEG